MTQDYKALIDDTAGLTEILSRKGLDGWASHVRELVDALESVLAIQHDKFCEEVLAERDDLKQHGDIRARQVVQVANVDHWEAVTKELRVTT